MKIKFLKQHDPYKQGDVADFAKGGADYLIQVGAAESTEEEASPKPEKKKARKPKAAKEKKKAGPTPKNKNAGPNPAENEPGS